VKGRKRTIRGDEKMADKDTMKTIGTILMAMALPIFIVNIALLKMPDTDLVTTTVLLIVSNCLFIPGLILSILSHLLQEKKYKMFVSDFEQYAKLLGKWMDALRMPETIGEEARMLFVESSAILFRVMPDAEGLDKSTS